METEFNRAGPQHDPDPRPELYSIDGSVPPEVMQRYGEWVARNPLHPGQHLAESLELKSLSVAEAAALAGVESVALDDVIAEHAPMTAELAVRLQAAGWARAVLWMRLQIAYDIVEARRRLVRRGAIAADAVHPDPRHEPDWDPEQFPALDPEPETEPAAALVG